MSGNGALSPLQLTRFIFSLTKLDRRTFESGKVMVTVTGFTWLPSELIAGGGGTLTEIMTLLKAKVEGSPQTRVNVRLSGLPVPGGNKTVFAVAQGKVVEAGPFGWTLSADGNYNAQLALSPTAHLECRSSDFQTALRLAKEAAKAVLKPTFAANIIELIADLGHCSNVPSAPEVVFWSFGRR